MIITDKQSAIQWMREWALPRFGQGFHLDNVAADYERPLSAEEMDEYEDGVQRIFDVAYELNEDPHEWALSVFFPTRKCECENITHMEDGAPERIAQRYEAHVYAAVDATVEVATAYGRFYICAECAERGHLR